MDPFYFQSIPLYAPVPVASNTPLLHDEPQQFYNQDGTYGDWAANVQTFDTTFMTPSELLCEVGPSTTPVCSSVDSESSDGRGGETARKARRRAVAKAVGFVPTDPDSISSHEKKRHYLECLELYIDHLHKTFADLKIPPPPLGRVASYEGLSNYSIRTLLVHMEHYSRQLNLRTVEEEKKFVHLREQVYLHEAQLN